MKHAASTATGRVNWKRFGLMMVPAGLVVGAFGFATASGALASSFAISGSNFTVTADELTGEGFVQYGGTVTPAGKSTTPVAVSGIRKATIKNMCQSVSLGPFALRLTAGDGGTPVTATDLVLDISTLTGDAEFGDMEIGRDASTLDAAGDIHADPKEGAGMFGQQADTVKITDLKQTAWATTAGTFNLPNLNLRFVGSGDVCK
ncbi:hypothetical protein EDD29_7611 [Actinocorallia herbida]|uniref:Cholesterol esterase n=1 Tax=Actinocorallia herbida TaxID=58109 RepID=A0A3N1D8T3_9ACTN|nr:DUF6230 family protein [Actinocorallia herbida]ROO89901.1 hypothetical protein EDD29_7611 [Actinocorallia herbida]